MRRLGKRIVAITLAATMMGSLTPQAMTFLQNEVVYAAETEKRVWESGDGQSLTFDASKDAKWTDTIFASNYEENKIKIADAEVGTTVKVKATVSVSTVEGLDGTKGTDEIDKAIQVASAIKTGSKGYAKSGDYPYLKADAFTDGKAEVEFNYTVKDADKGALQEIIFQYNTSADFTGTINITDVKVYDVEVKDTPTIKESKVWNSEDGQSLTFDASKDAKWTDTIFASNYEENKIKIADAEVGTTVKVKATVSVSTVEGLDGTKGTDEIDKAIQVASAIKTGSKGYAKSGDYPYLKADAFTDGKAEVEFNYTVKDADKGALQEIIFQYNTSADFTGTITIENVEVYDVVETGDSSIERQDPTVLSDLSTDADYSKWSEEGGWDYYHGGTKNTSPKISYDTENKRLAVGVDYSANSDKSWSEAKVKCTVSDPVSIKNYNQISVDVIYPEDKMPGTKIKFFAKDAQNTDKTAFEVYGAIDTSNAENLDNGYKKVTVTMNIKPQEYAVGQVTVSIIGCNTSYQGTVYLDNLKLSQKDATEDFVEITAQPGAGTTAQIKTPESIKITDASAGKSAKALYAYLQGLTANNQVLFGHQNDVNKSVNTSADLGDVADVTGSVSGVFGIDSLGVVGSEAGGTSSADALTKAVAASKKAADNGSIVTLSTHMPNFAATSLDGKEIVKDGDSYDFHKCDFNEAKVCTSNAIDEVLKEGSESNKKLNAYLDIIANYANQLAADDIPVIFRPYHENTGTWFWWGAQNSAESYKSLYRYTKDYLEKQGVHNMLYVYSPNGPLESTDEYMSRYPGDEYVDILAFDYYDDYSSTSEAYDDSYFTSLDETCKVVSKLAAEKGKIAAISECGVRVTREGSSEGLAIKGNPIRGQNWYQKVSDVAQKNKMPYYMVWANFSDTNFYVPYKYNDKYGQELINEFIEYYNDSSSVFGKGTGFKQYVNDFTNINTETYDEAKGYMVSPFDMAEITEPTELKAVVKNADSVSFVVKGADTVTIDATKGTDDTYTANLTTDAIKKVGGAEGVDTATITLVAKKGDKTSELATVKNISIGKNKPVAPANVLEDFDYYSGSNDLVAASYTGNSAAGCSSSFKLDTANKQDGSYAGAFNYKLKTTGSEVWTGQTKALTNTDLSAYDALKLWVKLDGKGQKVVIQLKSGNEEFEVLLNSLSTTNGSYNLTIPFSSFKGKNGGKFDPSNVTVLGIWCNSIGAVDLDSTIYFDGIQAVKATGTTTKVDANGFVIADANSGNNGGSTGGSTSGSTTPGTTTPNKPSSDTKTETTTETKPDGTKIETTTITKADGSVTKKSEITDASGKKTATVTVKTDATGKTTATASVTATAKSGAKTTISADTVKKITDVAGTDEVVISQRVADATGKVLYTVKANASDLTAGNKLSIVKYDKKTKKYVLVSKKEYKVSASGNVSVTIKNNGTYKLVSQKKADEITKSVLKTVKAKNTAKTLKKGQKTTMALSSALDKSNVSKITYSSSKSSVAKVDKNGKVTAKKAGTVTIKAKVILKNGKTKTVTMEVTVK